MNEPGVTLRDLLQVKGDAIRAAIDEHRKANPAWRAATGVLALVAEDGAKAVAEQLDVDPYKLIFNAWAAVAELREYTDPVKHPPAKRETVGWGKCSINAPQTVEIRVSFSGTPLPPLPLTLDLAAEFHSLALTIQGGAIRTITPGPAQASVSLKYRDMTLIAPRKTPELKFGRGIEFPEGLKIPI